MSSTSDAHAEMPSGTYSNRVCCGGVSGLGTSCSGNFDTVLRLSSATNAHVQTDSYSSYPNSVCLSVSTGAIDCTYASSCGSGYACLATISSDTNAHVADCGAGGYSTKVCCGLSCTNECSSSGQRQCSGSNSYQICGNYDADSCLEWGSATSCGTSSCAADSCTGVTTYYDYPILGSSTQGTCSNTCSGGSCSACSCTASQQTCSLGLSCQLASSNCGGGTVERCHRTNSGAWQWDTSLGTETACSDGYDNDCDGRADCQLGNEDTDCNCCNFASASITPNCGGGPCGIGDRISMSGVVSGSGCSSFNFFQIDASGSACSIAYSGGDISGISQANPSIVGGSVSGTWTISSIPSDCSSRTVSATGSGLYIGNPSSYSRAVFAGSSSGSFTFEDVTTPTTTINPDGRLWTNQNVPFTLSCSDTGGSCQATYYKIIDSSQACTSGGFSSGTSGTVSCPAGSVCQQRVCYYSTDNNGNAEPIKTSNVFQIDKQVPSTADNSNSAWASTDQTISLTCNDGSGSGCSQTRYCIDTTNSCTPSSTGNSVQVTCLSGSTCLQYVRYYSTDLAGNSEAVKSSQQIRIDKQVPTASMVINNGATFTNTEAVTLTLTYSDAGSGIKDCRYSNDGVWDTEPWEACGPSRSWSLTAGDGLKRVYYQVRDNAGNTVNAFDDITLDKTPPVCSTISITPSPRTPWTNQAFTVSWSCSDGPGSGILNYDVQNRAAWSNGTLVSDWTGWLTGTTLLSQGFTPAINNQTYSFRARATDNVGNTGSYSATAASTTFDNDFPQIISNGNDDKENKVFSITSAAWDSVSGIYNHTINCIVANPPPGQAPLVFVQCPSGTPFGGVSSCQTAPGISYEEDTEVNCVIMAEDRAGNTNSTSLFFSGSEQIVKLSEHTVFISIGETHHGRVYVRNIKSYADTFNVTITGTYPSGFARFLDSSSIIWMSLDKRNITVSLKPYEQKTLYLEITSTDVGEYTLEVSGASQKNPLLTGVDGMNIIIGFPAAFPGIEVLSITAILLISGLAYFRYLRRQNQI